MRKLVLVTTIWLLLPACKNTDVGATPCAAQQECSSCEACINDRCVEVEPSDDVSVDCGSAIDCQAWPSATGGRLPITTGVHRPIVTWAGTGYALTWYDIPNGAYFGFADLEGTLIASSVRSIDAEGLFPRSAFSGIEYAVVHVRDADITDQLPRELYLSRLDSTGELIAGSQVRVGTTTYPEDPAVVWNSHSREWGVLWEDHDDNGVFFARVDEAGHYIAGSQKRLSHPDYTGQLGGGGAPILVNGTDYIAVWSEALPGRVQLARIGADGVVVGIASHPAEQPYRASITWDGRGYGVAWIDPDETAYQVYFARADAQARFISASVVRLGEPGEHQSHPQVLWTGDTYSVLWSSYTDPTADVWLTHLSAEGTVIAREPLTAGSTRQWFPNAVWDGCRHVVFYAEDGPSRNAGHLVFVPAAP